jgi:EAL domain-containing protein (putative c-di-GMP-specific phosphodiesterase class I)
MGCRLALDDFGAGFSSFVYLKQLPFDVLKIDGEFVRHCTSNRADRVILESLVHTASGLEKQTVAEFVEDQETEDLLRELGVDLVQGYHVGRPVAVEEAIAALPAAVPFLAASAEPEPPQREDSDPPEEDRGQQQNAQRVHAGEPTARP